MRVIVIMSSNNTKIPLPEFLKALSSNGVSVKKAMEMAGKVYKTCNTVAALAEIDDSKLEKLGISNKDDRKLFIIALSKAGYAEKSNTQSNVVLRPEPNQSSDVSSSSNPTLMATKSPKRKRNVQGNKNEFLPNGSNEAQEEEDSGWDFGEILDDSILRHKSCVINRAPVMMAWSMLVAEKMQFSRAEALSIASVYTETNAISKGVSIGIYRPDEEPERYVTEGSQPYVELMGRKIPLYRTKTGEWRALSKGRPVPPIEAFQYITRSFRQTTPFVVGALKRLADSYTLKELSRMAWALYADFRPEANEWGKRSEILCSKILSLCGDLRNTTPTRTTSYQNSIPRVLHDFISSDNEDPQPKKVKLLKDSPSTIP